MGEVPVGFDGYKIPFDGNRGIKDWTLEDEKKLLDILDDLNSINTPYLSSIFCLGTSNISEYFPPTSSSDFTTIVPSILEIE